MIEIKIDPGFKTTGFAVVENDKALEMGELHHRTDVPKRMNARKQYRRFRRYRNTRYRKPRFNNRKRHNGWLPPSIKSRVFSTIKIIQMFSKKYSTKTINLEVSNFDTHALANGVSHLPNWAYQKGPLYNWENIKMYVRARDNYTCQYCKKVRPKYLEVDHIIPKSRGGTDRSDNLVAACHKCNEEKGNRTAEEFGCIDVQRMVKKSQKTSTLVNITAKEIFRRLSDIGYTVTYHYGYITKINRELLALPKTHYYDACCIGTVPEKLSLQEVYTYHRQVAKCSRILTRRKGKKKKMISNKLPFEVFGFRMWDKVEFNGNIGFISSRRSSGYFKISDIQGKMIKDGFSYKKLILLHHNGSVLLEQKPALLSRINSGASCRRSS